MVKNEGKRKYTTITIPTNLYDRIREKLKGTSFSSVSDYVTFLLREIGSEVALKKNNDKETENLLGKLRALGYA